MLSLPQTTGYAMLALSCLADAREPRLLARAIARATGTPLPYLSKILHALRRSGLIAARRGYRGGFALTRPSSAISLYDVALAVEEGDPLGPCLLGLRCSAPTPPCPTHEFWLRERSRIERHLRRISIADVARLHGRRRGDIRSASTKGVKGRPERHGTRSGRGKLRA
jgi:Rrf2 family protein